MLDFKSRCLIIAASTLALATACLNGEPEPPEPDYPSIVEEEVMTLEPPEATPLQDAVSMARHDLADRLGVNPEDIHVAQSRHVTWRDGALGCPEEDMMYTQALVEGFYILLEVDGRAHAYHAGRDGVPFPCPAKRSQPPYQDDQPEY